MKRITMIKIAKGVELNFLNELVCPWVIWKRIADRIQNRKPMHFVSLFSNGGFAASPDECFVNRIGFFWIKIFYPRTGGAEHTRGCIGIVRHQFRGGEC